MSLTTGRQTADPELAALVARCMDVLRSCEGLADNHAPEWVRVEGRKLMQKRLNELAGIKVAQVQAALPALAKAKAERDVLFDALVRIADIRRHGLPPGSPDIGDVAREAIAKVKR